MVEMNSFLMRRFEDENGAQCNAQEISQDRARNTNAETFIWKQFIALHVEIR